MRLTDRFVTAFATLALVTSGFVPAPALASPKDELEAARRELEAYGQKLAEVQIELVKGADALNVTQSQIVERQAEAKKTKKKLKTAQSTMAEHMRENYRAGNATLISILLDAETIEDLVCNVYYLDKIAERNSNDIAQVRDLQESLDTQVTELEEQRAEQQEMLEQAVEQANEYAEQIEVTQAYYNELDAKVREQLAAEAAAAAAAAAAPKASQSTKQEQSESYTNEYGVITDGVQNAVTAATEEPPTPPDPSEIPTVTTEESDETSETDSESTDGSSDTETNTETETDTETEGDETAKDDDGSEKDAESDTNEEGEQEGKESADSTDDTETSKKDTADSETSEEEEESSTTKNATETVSEQEQEPEASTEPEASAVPEPVETPTYSSDAARQDIINKAYEYLGVPYVWGGKSPDGFDCSGLTTYVYENSGIDVGGNRTTYQLIDWMQENGTWKTSLDELQPGDMLFPSSGHVAIYLGDGKMIHAPHEGDVVRVADVYAFYGGGWAG